MRDYLKRVLIILLVTVMLVEPLASYKVFAEGNNNYKSQGLIEKNEWGGGSSGLWWNRSFRI